MFDKVLNMPVIKSLTITPGWSFSILIFLLRLVYCLWLNQVGDSVCESKKTLAYDECLHCANDELYCFIVGKRYY